MSIEDVLESMRALRAWQDANTPPIRIGAWRVLPWVEPVAFEAVVESRYAGQYMMALRPPEPSYKVVGFGPYRVEEPVLEQVVLVAMQWKLGNRVATVYWAEADDERVQGALCLFALAMRFFEWVENHACLLWVERKERGVCGMRCEP